jgi:hypothetical protein
MVYNNLGTTTVPIMNITDGQPRPSRTRTWGIKWTNRGADGELRGRRHSCLGRGWVAIAGGGSLRVRGVRERRHWSGGACGNACCARRPRSCSGSSARVPRRTSGTKSRRRPDRRGQEHQRSYPSPHCEPQPGARATDSRTMATRVPVVRRRRPAHRRRGSACRDWALGHRSATVLLSSGRHRMCRLVVEGRVRLRRSEGRGLRGCG